MENKQVRELLAKEVPAWVAENIISPAQGESLLSRYANQGEVSTAPDAGNEKRETTLFSSLLVFVGLILVHKGVDFILDDWWKVQPPGVAGTVLAVLWGLAALCGVVVFVKRRSVFGKVYASSACAFFLYWAVAKADVTSFLGDLLGYRGAMQPEQFFLVGNINNGIALGTVVAIALLWAYSRSFLTFLIWALSMATVFYQHYAIMSVGDQVLWYGLALSLIGSGYMAYQWYRAGRYQEVTWYVWIACMLVVMATLICFGMDYLIGDLVIGCWGFVMAFVLPKGKRHLHWQWPFLFFGTLGLFVGGGSGLLRVYGNSQLAFHNISFSLAYVGLCLVSYYLVHASKVDASVRRLLYVMLTLPIAGAVHMVMLSYRWDLLAQWFICLYLVACIVFFLFHGVRRKYSFFFNLGLFLLWGLGVKLIAIFQHDWLVGVFLCAMGIITLLSNVFFHRYRKKPSMYKGYNC